jgi:hypothetical protein
MLTGVPSPNNGVRDYFDALPSGARTIAHEMKGRFYATAFFGKWHLSKRDSRARLTGEEHARVVVPPGSRGGFDFWEGFESGFLLNDPWLHGTRLPEPVRFDGYQSDVICDRAGAMLSAWGGPWFAVVSLEAPHPPYHGPAAGIPAAEPAGLVLRGNVPRGEAGRGGPCAQGPDPGTMPTSRPRTGRSVRLVDGFPRTQSWSRHCPSTGTCTAPTGSSARGGPTRKASGCRSWSAARPRQAGTPGPSPSSTCRGNDNALGGGQSGSCAADNAGTRADSRASRCPPSSGCPTSATGSGPACARPRSANWCSGRTARPGFSLTWRRDPLETRNLVNDPDGSRQPKSRG